MQSKAGVYSNIVKGTAFTVRLWMFSGTKGPLGTAFVQFRESGGKDAKSNTLGEITVILG